MSCPAAITSLEEGESPSSSPSARERRACAYAPHPARFDIHESPAELVLDTVRAYLSLGMISAASDLLDAVAHHATTQPLWMKLRESLDSVPDSRLSWESCTGRFRRNLEVLVGRYPETSALEDVWSTVKSNFELYCIRDGNYQVARLIGSGRREWLPALADHRNADELRPLAHTPGTMMPRPYLFEGLGFGWFFRRIYQATRGTFLTYSSPLFVVERELAALAISLHLWDWRDVLSDPRVYLFAGRGAVPRLARHLLRHDDLPLPGVCVRSGFWRSTADPNVADAVQDVVARRGRRHCRSFARITGQYAERDVHYWARRFSQAIDGSGPPLRILSTTSRHTTFLKYSMRDVARAFELLGHQCRVLIEQSDHHALGSRTVHRAIMDFEPDLLFSIDHLRPSHRDLVPAQLPIITWDQDLLPHIFTSDAIRQMGPTDVIAGVSKLHCINELHCPEDRLCYSVIPTNPEVYDASPIAEGELERYRCDLSYVSNASQTAESFHLEERSRLVDTNAMRLWDSMYKLAVDFAAQGGFVGGTSGDWILPEAERQTGVQVTDETVRNRVHSWYLWRLGDRLFRHQALAWAADWALRTGRRFHLYGRGWEHHPELRGFARGVAGNGHELRCIYQASTINLQLMPAGFVHQRALDGLAAGGFFIARRCPADFQLVTMQKIAARLSALGASEHNTLDFAADKLLQSAIEDHARVTGYRFDPSDRRSWVHLRCTLEMECAGNCFPRFDELSFHDAATFEAAAERFMADPHARRARVEEMRKVVLERFTYVAAMERFLRFMRERLARVAEGNEPMNINP